MDKRKTWIYTTVGSIIYLAMYASGGNDAYLICANIFIAASFIVTAKN